jgi:TPP-dependent indolepyruvate ferredoxin oxidoreductase alpha subunit
MMQKPQQQQIKMELKEPESEGIYSNLAMIVHSPSEVIIDFARITPGVPKARVYSRIIMTPQNAKNLLKSLQDNLKKFEDRFGEIKVQGMPDEKNIGFIQPGQEGE